jgi:hypothetical protein
MRGLCPLPIRCGVPSLPCIVVTNRELRDLTEDALGAVQLANQPPTLFQRGGALTRLRHSEQQVPFLEVLTESAVRGLMARTADWRRQTLEGLVPVAPPMPVVKGFPLIPGRYGRIEWFDGQDLAVYSDRPRFFLKVWAIPGVRRCAFYLLHPPRQR